jgi:Radical SAM superfamily
MIATICFLTTYQCNAKCDFCECGPSVKTRVALPDMLRLIDEAADLGTVSVVIFSGGEPTLLGEDLFAAIRHATKRGLLTRIVTNGWWGKSEAKALDFVDRLLDAGLSEINISIDDLHQEWIPLQSVVHAFRACYSRRLQCLIAHKQLKGATLTQAYLSEAMGIELVQYRRGHEYTEDERCRLISTSTVIPVGPSKHAPNLNEHVRSSWRGSCGSVLRDIIVGAGTHFLPCCGIVTKELPELVRSDLRTTSLIDAIDEANNDLILNWIALEGPAAIAEFVHSKDPSVLFADEYIGICHICNEVLSRPDVRRVLAQYIDEISQRIGLHRAYLELTRSEDDIAKTYVRT